MTAKLLGAALAAALFASPAFALDKDLEATIRRLNDPAAFTEADLSPVTVVIIYAGGQTLSLNRAQMIQAAAQSKAALTEYKLEEIKVAADAVQGDLATVAYSVRVSAKMGGTSMIIQNATSETYTKASGKWQLVASVSRQ